MQAQLAVNEALLGMMLRKREALREADHRVLPQLCELEYEKIRKLSELEKQRLTLIGELTEAWTPDAATPLRLPDIAERLAEPTRGRLLVLRMQLREKMEQLREQTQVTRRVTEALGGHMRGLIQSISAACCGMASYNQQGATPEAAMTMSTFSATA